MTKRRAAATVALLGLALVLRGDINPSTPYSNTAGTNDYQTAQRISPSQTAVLTSGSASGKRLAQIDVWSSIAYAAFLFTVNNTVESTNPVAAGGAPAAIPFVWKPPSLAYVVLGTSGGLDAFRVKVTNLDAVRTADVYVVFHYEN